MTPDYPWIGSDTPLFADLDGCEVTVQMMRVTCGCGTSTMAVIMDGMTEGDATAVATERLRGHRCVPSRGILIAGIVP